MAIDIRGQKLFVAEVLDGSYLLHSSFRLLIFFHYAFCKADQNAMETILNFIIECF
jgi:hypothetical protein